MKNLELYIQTHVNLAVKIKEQQSDVVNLFNRLDRNKHDIMRHLLSERTSAIIAFYYAQEFAISTHEGFDDEAFFSEHGKVIKACDKTVLTSSEFRYRGKECRSSNNAAYISHVSDNEVLFNEKNIEDMFTQLEIAKSLIKAELHKLGEY